MDRKNVFTTVLLLNAFAIHIEAQGIAILENNNIIPIEQQQTQTQISPGWKIVDLQLPSKVQRYLWGQHAKDVPVGNPRRPKFIIDTDSLLLGDMVLVKLKTRREYRLIPKPDIHDCPKIFCDMTNFSIEAYKPIERNGEREEPAELFLVQPIKDLEPGEYILVWLTAPTVGKYSDWKVWPLSIR